MRFPKITERRNQLVANSAKMEESYGFALVTHGHDVFAHGLVIHSNAPFEPDSVVNEMSARLPSALC